MVLSDGLRELEVGLHLEEHCQLARQGLKRRYTRYKHIGIGHEPNITQVISFLNLFQEPHILKIGVTTFPFTLNYYDIPFYSSLRPDRSRLILYDILTALSVSSTADFLLIDYFSHDYSS